jgi:hypothetical protein
MEGVRHHCAQCLTEVYSNSQQTPAGDLLCEPCYSALWGPKVTDEFRGLVRLHTGHPMPGQLASQPAR